MQVEIRPLIKPPKTLEQIKEQTKSIVSQEINRRNPKDQTYLYRKLHYKDYVQTTQVSTNTKNTNTSRTSASDQVRPWQVKNKERLPTLEDNIESAHSGLESET